MSTIRSSEAPYDPNLAVVTARCCDQCGWTWKKYQDGPDHCPSCVPGQPTPFAVRLADPTDFLGPDWVWCTSRGQRGMWVPLDDFVVMSRPEFEALLRVLKERLDNETFERAFAAGVSVISQLSDHIEHGSFKWEGDARPDETRRVPGALVHVSPHLRSVK